MAIKRNAQALIDNGSWLSRRQLLKGSMLAGAGALSLGFLGSCAPKNTEGTESGSSSQTWDKEVDILVVGSGTAAIAAASAKGYDPDLSVLIIEKGAFFGGTTATSGAALWIPLNYWAVNEGYKDSKERALEYMVTASAGRCDPELCRVYIDNGYKYLEWTRDTFGWNWVFGGGADYLQGLPGNEPDDFFGRTVKVELDDSGVSYSGMVFWPQLRILLEDLNTEIMMETTGKTLLTDDDGRVIGAVASTTAGREIRIKAHKGVVLGTGGFDFNPEMITRFQAIRPYVSNSVQTNTGDGQNMGTAVGGALSLMELNWGLPAFLPGKFSKDFDKYAKTVYDFEHNDWLQYRGKPNAAVFNKQGRRFGNEATAYPIFNRSFATWNSYTYEFENIPAFFICDSEYFRYYTVPGQSAVGDPIPEYMVQADTLEGLAGILGIDAQGLAQEIEGFNEDCKTGVDSKYHRGENFLEKTISGDYAGRELLNKCLAPIQTPPFFGATYVPGTCGTNGGLVINSHAQVLGTDNAPIEGLYAVGNCSAGVSGGTYMGSGMTVGSGSVMSWLAVQHMLGKE